MIDFAAGFLWFLLLASVAVSLAVFVLALVLWAVDRRDERRAAQRLAVLAAREEHARRYAEGAPVAAVRAPDGLEDFMAGWDIEAELAGMTWWPR